MSKEFIKDHQDLEIYKLPFDAARELYGTYNQVLSGLVNMINNPFPWLMNQ